MNEKNMDSIMHAYANSVAAGRQQDLCKFKAQCSEKHHSKAPRIRRVILLCICILSVALFCVSLVLSKQPHSPYWNVGFAVFSEFHAGKENTPVGQTQTMAATLDAFDPAERFLGHILFPTVQCSDVVLNWMTRTDDTITPIGVLSTLHPANSAVTKISACYLMKHNSENIQLIVDIGFSNLPHTIIWQQYKMSYSDCLQTDDGPMYKVYLEHGEFCICLDIYAPADMEITNLLSLVFG